MRKHVYKATDDEQQLIEMIKLILSGEVKGVTIIGQSLDGDILDPMIEAEAFAKVMGFETLINLEKQNDANTIDWAVRSIGTAEKGECKHDNEN